MTEKEIKRKLEDDGYRIADIARHLASEFSIKVESADTTLRELIAGRRWFPTYANWLKKNYGVIINKPAAYKPIRERLKAA